VRLESLIVHVIRVHPRMTYFVPSVALSSPEIEIFRACIAETIRSAYTRTVGGRITTGACIYPAHIVLPYLTRLIHLGAGSRFSLGKIAKVTLTRYYLLAAAVGDVHVLWKTDAVVAVSPRYPFVLKFAFLAGRADDILCKVTMRFSIARSKCVCFISLRPRICLS